LGSQAGTEKRLLDRTEKPDRAVAASADWLRRGRAAVVWIERHLAFEQCAGEREQPIADGPQSAAMSVSAQAQRGVAGTAGWIAHGDDARPVVERIGQAFVAGQAPQHDAALAAAPGDRGGTTQSS